jgi:hypothetical protein
MDLGAIGFVGWHLWQTEVAQCSMNGFEAFTPFLKHVSMVEKLIAQNSISISNKFIFLEMKNTKKKNYSLTSGYTERHFTLINIDATKKISIMTN